MNWRKISDAQPPRDGTEIWTCNKQYSGCSFGLAKWDGKGWLGMCDGGKVIEREADDFSRTEYLYVYFTHWMPVQSPQ